MATRRVTTGSFRTNPPQKPAVPTDDTPAAEAPYTPSTPEQPEWMDWMGKGQQALSLINKGRQLWNIGSTLGSAYGGAAAGSAAEAAAFMHAPFEAIGASGIAGTGAAGALSAAGSMAAQAGPLVVAGLIAKHLMKPNVDNYWGRITTGDTDAINAHNQASGFLTKDDYISVMQAELDKATRAENIAAGGDGMLFESMKPIYEYEDGEYEKFLAQQDDDANSLALLKKRKNGLGQELDQYEQVQFEDLREDFGYTTATEYSDKDAKYDPLHEVESPFGKITLSGWTDLGDEFTGTGKQVVDLMGGLDTAIAARLTKDELAMVKDALDGLDQQTTSWNDYTQDVSGSLNGLLRDRYRIVAKTIGDDALARFDELTESGMMVTDAVVDMLGGKEAVEQSLSVSKPRYFNYDDFDGVTRR